MNTIINFLFASIKVGAPLLMGTTGEIITEKSGSLNLGVEGLMALGSIAGFYMAAVTESLFMGILFGFLFAAFGGLIFAFLTVTLKSNQNVTGLALAIFGGGLQLFIGQRMRLKGTYPSISHSLANALAEKPIPGLGDIPYIGKLFFSHNIFVYIIIFIALACWFYLRFTKKGLRLNAVGENPSAADAAGINVTLSKYIHIIIGSGICGIGGAYLSLINHSGSWNDYWIGGMGWISLALVIFASWSPAKAILGSFIFGMFTALKDRAADLANAFPAVLSWLTMIPKEFYKMLPFILTALILVISSIRKKKSSAQPTACGVNYIREER